MGSVLWSWLATPGASLLAGTLILFVLLARLQATGRTISHLQVGGAVILGAAFYTVLIAVCGQFFLKIPVATTVDHFGSERVAWVLVGFATDVFLRLHALFRA